MLFIPDTTGLDLREQERYWSYVRDGRGADYHGIAIHPRHISMYERIVLRRHRYYNPQMDRDAKVEELRQKYEASLQDNDPMDDVSHNVTAYFDEQKARRTLSGETKRDEGRKLEEEKLETPTS